MILAEHRKFTNGMLFNKHHSTLRHGRTFPLLVDDFIGDGELSDDGRQINLRCVKDQGAFQLRKKLSDTIEANGIGMRFKVSGWKEISYVAVGFTLDGEFVHVKIPHVLQNNWISFSYSFNDLIFLIQNKWRSFNRCFVSECRIFLKGVPGQSGGRLALTDVALWLEKDESEFGSVEEVSSDVDLVKVICEYWKSCFKDYARQTELSMAEGMFPVFGGRNLRWSPREKKPEGIFSVNTYRFSWHALHSVSMYLLRYRDTGETSFLIAATDFVNSWLDSSFFSPDEDQKYTWYDHGTAERTLVLIVMLQLATELDLGLRFKSRILYSLAKHAQLLCSEAFYASHQVTRYHNHAWFQDIALIAAAISLKKFSVSQAWLKAGFDRLKDQLSHLVHRESGFAVFVENSIGYHQGVQRLVDFAGKLEKLAGSGDLFSRTAAELELWSNEFRFPDGRVPAQGDTFRKPNPDALSELKRIAGWERKILALPDAGYAVFKGGAVQTPWMFGMLGTNKNSTHKHEDDLSFFLWLDGVEWFTDPSFMSHEYKDEIPAYLRSARAHNMLHVDGAEYSYYPRPGRVVMDVQKSSCGGSEELSIRGYNRSCLGFEITRSLVCSDVEGFPKIICDDHFSECSDLALDGEAEPLYVGVLTFHFAEGVEVQPAGEFYGRTLFKLSHPASMKKLVLAIGRESDPRVWNSILEPSVSGLSFMECVDTQALRIRVPIATECHWSIDVE